MSLPRWTACGEHTRQVFGATSTSGWEPSWRRFNPGISSCGMCAAGRALVFARPLFFFVIILFFRCIYFNQVAVTYK